MKLEILQEAAEEMNQAIIRYEEIEPGWHPSQGGNAQDAFVDRRKLRITALAA